MAGIGTITSGFDGTIVLGLASVRQRMLDLPRRLGQAVVRRGLYAGQAVIRDDAKARVPVRTGALKRALVARTNRVKGKTTEFRGYVSIDRKAFGVNAKGRLIAKKRTKGQKVYVKGDIYPRNYAHLVHGGTKPHSLKSKKRPARPGDGPGAMHPGSQPHPFLAQAYLSKRYAAVVAIRDKTLLELDTELRKLGKSGVALGRGAA